MDAGCAVGDGSCCEERPNNEPSAELIAPIARPQVNQQMEEWMIIVFIVDIQILLQKCAKVKTDNAMMTERGDW